MTVDTNINALLAALQRQPQEHTVAQYAAIQWFDETLKCHRAVDARRMRDAERTAYLCRYLMHLLACFAHLPRLQIAIFDQLYEGKYAHCPEYFKQALLCEGIERRMDMTAWLTWHAPDVSAEERLPLFTTPSSCWTSRHWLIFFKWKHDIYLSYADRDFLVGIAAQVQ